MNFCHKTGKPAGLKKNFDASECAGKTTQHPSMIEKPPYYGTMFDITKTLDSSGNNILCISSCRIRDSKMFTFP